MKPGVVLGTGGDCVSRITIKKFKESKSLSEETMAYTADVYFDGKKVGRAVNRGHGGMTMVDPYDGTQEGLRAADAWARENPLPVGGGNVEGKPHDFKTSDLGEYADELAYRESVAGDLRRALSKRVLMLKPDGKIYECRPKPGATLDPAAVARMVPDAKVLNLMPFDEALALYIASA